MHQTAASASPTAASQALVEANEIAEKLSLSDSLQQLKNRTVKGMIFSGDDLYSDAAVLMSSTGTADTVGVFYVTDFDTAKTDIQNYLKNLETQTNVYDATEIFKISNAVMEDNGSNKIVVIIASDIEAARKLAKQAVQ
ncbi:MAG: DUF4358 domain-containing protein [Lactimicrobium sp.]|uniref:DUF4358 domain-containing protein n=1 Tax=Lactimicrobium sp. TaxID=2563780 RepID=UPI002F358A0F